MEKFKLVSFAQKKGYQVEDPKLYQHVIHQLESKYRLNLKTGSKYYKFLEEKELSILRKYEHLVCFNLNHKPTYLFLTTYQDQKYCFYINGPTNQIISVKHRFEARLYQDTLIEGELIKVSQYHYIYLISDLLGYQFKVNQDPLPKKIEILQEIIEKDFKPDPGLDPCQIQVKDFIEYQYLESFFKDYLPTLAYQQYISGLIFRPITNSNKNIIVVLNKPRFHQIRINTSKGGVKDSRPPSVTNSDRLSLPSPKLGKPKNEDSHGQHSSHQIITGPSLENNKAAPEAEQTLISSILATSTPHKKKSKINHRKYSRVNFEISQTNKPDVYELYLLNHNSETFKYGIASIQTLQCSELIKKLFGEKKEDLALIVKCEYLKSFNKWRPLSLSSQDHPDTVAELIN